MALRHGPGRLSRVHDRPAHVARPAGEGRLERFPDDRGPHRTALFARGHAPNTSGSSRRDSPSGTAGDPLTQRRVGREAQRLLDQGNRFCCLYTDAANPTSNSIYGRIGYRPIRDDVEIAWNCSIVDHDWESLVFSERRTDM